MKRILESIVIAACLWFIPFQNQAQVSYGLVIDSLVGIPDTIADGDTVTFYMIVSTNSSLFFQGNIYAELEYGGSFFEADISIPSDSSISPVSSTTIQAFHRFSSDDGLSIGDNVVVVWPRIGDGTTPDQSVVNPHTQIITLTEPNAISEHNSNWTKRSFVSPNPASSHVMFDFGKSTKVTSTTVYDITGSEVHRSNVTHGLDVSGFRKGIYIIEALTEDGQIYFDRVLIAR